MLYLHFEAWDWGLSVHVDPYSPRLQFETRLPDSPKTEVKGVVLVKGSLYQIPGSLGLSFNLN